MPVTTWTSGWAHRNGIPTVFEPLGMFRARLRKVALKHYRAALQAKLKGTDITVPVPPNIKSLMPTLDDDEPSRESS